MPDILDKLIGTVRDLRSLENPKTPLSNPAPWLYDALGAGGPVASGMRVSPASSLGLTAFWACVKIIAETTASLPLPLYRNLGEDQKERAIDRPEYAIFQRQFNPIMSSMVAREVTQAHLLTWGNGYMLIRWNGAQKLDSLWPLQSSKTHASTTAGVLVYETSDTPDGRLATYNPEDILHVPGLSFDGLHGMSPVQVHRETLGHGMATERYGAAFFGKGERPAGVLEHPAQLGNESYSRLKKDMEELRSDRNPHKTLILEDGMKYHVISVPPEDAQYIETRRFNISDMARIFNVPLSMLAEHEKSSSYASVEQFFLNFIVHTIRPWLIRWEQEINRKIFGINNELFCEHLIDGFLRGDIKSRYDAYHVAKQDGWISSDEIRAKENLNEMPDGQGKVFFVPANMLPIDRVLNPPKPSTPAASPVDPNAADPNAPNLNATQHGPNGKAIEKKEKLDESTTETAAA